MNELVEVMPNDGSAQDVPVLIAMENIPIVWPLVEPRISSLLRKMEFVEVDAPRVFELLMKQEAQLWIQGEMIAVTRIVNYSNIKRLVVDFIEGRNRQNYREQMQYIEHWAIGLGCTQAETELRPGFERIAKEEGWKRVRVKMFKKLEKGLH